MKKLLFVLLPGALVVLGVVLEAVADNGPIWVADTTDVADEADLAVVGRTVVVMPKARFPEGIAWGNPPPPREERRVDGPIAFFGAHRGERRHVLGDGESVSRILLGGGQIHLVANDDSGPLIEVGTGRERQERFDLPDGTVERMTVAPSGWFLAMVFRRRAGGRVLLLRIRNKGIESVDMPGPAGGERGDLHIRAVSAGWLLVEEPGKGLRGLNVTTRRYFPEVIASADAKIELVAGFVLVSERHAPRKLWRFDGDRPELVATPRSQPVADPYGEFAAWVEDDADGTCIHLRRLMGRGVDKVPVRMHEELTGLTRGATTALVRARDEKERARLLSTASGKTLQPVTCPLPCVSAGGTFVVGTGFQNCTLHDARTGRVLASRPVGNGGRLQPIRLHGDFAVVSDLRMPLGGLPFSLPTDGVGGETRVFGKRTYDTVVESGGRERLRFPADEGDAVCMPYEDATAFVLRKGGGLWAYGPDLGKPWTLIIGLPVLLGGLAFGFERFRGAAKRTKRRK